MTVAELCKNRVEIKNKKEKMIMAIQFKEIRQYLARNTRLSICFEDGCYHDYLMISDISG